MATSLRSERLTRSLAPSLLSVAERTTLHWVCGALFPRLEAEGSDDPQLFATDAMRATFSDRARLAAMLRAEAALARAEARSGIVPDTLASAVEAIPAADLDPAALGERTALAGVPTIPFVKAVQARLPKELERGFHKGATTQDIVDTALVL